MRLLRKQEPAVQPLPQPDGIDDVETARAVARINGLQRDNVRLTQRVADLETYVDQRDAHSREVTAEKDRIIAHLRQELAIAEAKRDLNHERAVEAETALNICAKMIMDAQDRARAKGAQDDVNAPRGREGAVDLDEQVDALRGQLASADSNEASETTELSRG